MYNQWRESVRWRDLQTISVARSRYHYGPDVFQNKLEGLKALAIATKTQAHKKRVLAALLIWKRFALQKSAGRAFGRTKGDILLIAKWRPHLMNASMVSSWSTQNSVILDTTMRSSKSLTPQSQPYWVVQRKLNLSRKKDRSLRAVKASVAKMVSEVDRKKGLNAVLNLTVPPEVSIM